MRKDIFILILMCIAVLSVAFFWGDLDQTRGDAPGKPTGELLSREQLQANFRRDRRITIVYGAGRREFSAGFQAAANAFRDRVSSFGVQVEVLADSQAQEADLRGTTLYLMGSVSSNRLLASLSRGLPVELGHGSFSFNHQTYDRPQDVLYLFYPSPWDRQFGLTVITGNSDRAVLNYVEREGWRTSGDYRISREGSTLVLGSFSQQPEHLWEIDPANHLDFAAAERLATSTAHYRFHLHQFPLSAKELDQFAGEREEQLRKIAGFLGLHEPLPSIDYHLYPSAEIKGLMTGNTRPAHLSDSDNSIHCTLEPGLRGDDGSGEALLLIRQKFGGTPATALLKEGLSVYLAGDWHQQGFRYWAGRIYNSGNSLPLAELLDNQQLERLSSLVRAALAGSFVSFLIEKWGQEKFFQEYRNWKPLPGELPLLQTEWHSYLSRLNPELQAADSSARSVPAPTSLSGPAGPSFQKGFCFAHEGYQIYDGYISRKADAALQRLAEMGTNSVSLTPFTFVRDGNRPAAFPFVRSPGSETDESVIHAAFTARKEGMAIMLKPHIWLGRSWPGEIEMHSAADWQSFFKEYQRWITHYALMAEIYGWEYLCIGVELSKATVGHEAEWRRMIAAIRKLYHGKLTYAANWGKEFENIAFWDALDFIGINCYYPLSDKDTPSDQQLKEGMEQVANRIATVAARFHRPVVFTEIGFTSTAQPWKQPHESRGRRKVDLEDQARCYRAAVEVLQNCSWMAGIYWWKWPSFLDYGGPQDSDFTPNGKPAEAIVRDWYQQMP